MKSDSEKNMYEFSAENNSKRFLADSQEFDFYHSSEHTNLYEEIENNKKNIISENLKKYMPIGSVVRVDNSDQLCMIIGFQYIDNNNNEYDYLASYYPYGIDKQHSLVFFNHSQILSTYHIGYINALERNFKESLNTTPKTDEGKMIK